MFYRSEFHKIIVYMEKYLYLYLVRSGAKCWKMLIVEQGRC